jgi:hypothetical protein
MTGPGSFCSDMVHHTGRWGGRGVASGSRYRSRMRMMPKTVHLACSQLSPLVQETRRMTPLHPQASAVNFFRHCPFEQRAHLAHPCMFCTRCAEDQCQIPIMQPSCKTYKGRNGGTCIFGCNEADRLTDSLPITGKLTNSDLHPCQGTWA